MRSDEAHTWGEGQAVDWIVGHLGNHTQEEYDPVAAARRCDEIAKAARAKAKFFRRSAISRDAARTLMERARAEHDALMAARGEERYER